MEFMNESFKMVELLVIIHVQFGWPNTINDSLLSLWGMTQQEMESNVTKLYMFVETY